MGGGSFLQRPDHKFLRNLFEKCSLIFRKFFFFGGCFTFLLHIFILVQFYKRPFISFFHFVEALHSQAMSCHFSGSWTVKGYVWPLLIWFFNHPGRRVRLGQSQAKHSGNRQQSPSHHWFSLPWEKFVRLWEVKCAISKKEDLHNPVHQQERAKFCVALIKYAYWRT